MKGPLDWSLLYGAVPVAAMCVGFVALVALLIGRNRRWWLRTVPVVVVVAALATFAIKFAVDNWWKPWPDPLPKDVVIWTAYSVLGVTLAAFRFRSHAWRGRLLTVLAVVPVLVMSLIMINSFFVLYPTLRDALGQSVKPVEFARDTRPVVRPEPGQTMAQVWTPPPGMPAKGELSEIHIPPDASGFRARSGWLYRPPAYLTSPRALLPVLVLLAGQPGEPRHWIDAGQIHLMMDAYAASHGGLAPIVVVPDDLGAFSANPMCLDSRLGNVETYLSVDVPNWIKANLQVDTDPRAWTIAGSSHGGTCALQLAVRAPEVYPHFIDVSGQREPTRGTRKATVQAAFGGDDAKFADVNPLDILARKKFPQTSGVIVAGAKDHKYEPQAREVFAACQAAGMDINFLLLPGAHDWSVWRGGVEQSLPWLASHTGLTGR